MTDFAVPSIDPSLINHDMNRALPIAPPYDQHFQQSPNYTPSYSSTSPQPNLMRNNSPSPFHHAPYQSSFPNSPYPVLLDVNTGHATVANFMSPNSGGDFSGSKESREKHRCPDCGRVFKDLKAHLLTHMSSRPEKCPIPSCEYHIKGFARKYDKNRHTLTHYKGTMVCGFCPGPGSPAEKSFNRADVFKRHLTTVHGVEQTPPNSRKRTTAVPTPGKKLTGYASDATGKCSTCSQTFSNAQDFYEHLDECVLRIVQQEDPAEAINEQRLLEVENDVELQETLERHDLLKDPLPQTSISGASDDEDDIMSEDGDGGRSLAGDRLSPSNEKRLASSHGIQKSKGMTHSRGGVKLNPKKKGRRSMENHPRAWGLDNSQLKWKKRVIGTFDGSRRLCKDDLALPVEQQVRIELPDGKNYTTDLDIQSIRRAEGWHSATAAERGPYVSDDPTTEQRKEMQDIQDMLTCGIDMN